MTDTSKRTFTDPFFWHNATESGGPELHLGSIYDFDLGNMIVVAIRNLALQSADALLCEYSLKLMLDFKKWKDIVVAEQKAKDEAERAALEARAPRTHL